MTRRIALSLAFIFSLFCMLSLPRLRAENVKAEISKSNPPEKPTTQSIADGFEAIFNGKDLTGWEGNKELWSAENGEIVGKSAGIKKNEFLATTARYSNFILKFKFRIVNTSGQANSGMQFRSERVANSTECYGYQADVGQDYWGCLYDESRRKKVLVKPDKTTMEKAVKRDPKSADAYGTE